MALSDSSWQDFPDSGRITVTFIIFYQGGKIDHVTYVPVPVAQSSAESEYNAAFTAVMDLAHCRMLIHELLNKYPYIVPEEDLLIILDIISAVCMDRNGKDTKNTSHISRRVNLVRNGEKWKMHKVDWCEGGLKLEDIVAKNVSDNGLNPRIKYIMVRFDNW